MDHHHAADNTKSATKVRFADSSDTKHEDLFNHDTEDAEPDDTDEKNEVMQFFSKSIFFFCIFFT